MKWKYLHMPTGITETDTIVMDAGEITRENDGSAYLVLTKEELTFVLGVTQKHVITKK